MAGTIPIERVREAYANLTDAERSELERLSEELVREVETGIDWVNRRFPGKLSAAFAPHHAEFWHWIDTLRLSNAPDTSHVACWARGGGKSTTLEYGAGCVCDRLSRRFLLVVSSTQEKADERVQNIATILEAMGVQRRLSRYGHAKGWRREQLQAANGFNVAAFGLDTGMRGVKIENYRPDWLALDDIDEITDTLL